jgi:hypothetical protein
LRWNFLLLYNRMAKCLYIIFAFLNTEIILQIATKKGKLVLRELDN